MGLRERRGEIGAHLDGATGSAVAEAAERVGLLEEWRGTVYAIDAGDLTGEAAGAAVEAAVAEVRGVGDGAKGSSNSGNTGKAEIFS